MAWVVKNKGNNEYYDLYIGGDEGVEARNCGSLFYKFSKCETVDLENFYTDKVENFAGMFEWCTSLKKIENLEMLDTGCAKRMESFFMKCTSLEQINVSNFVTDNVEYMQAMFYQVAAKELDVSNFNTSKVTRMDEMFRQCYYLEELDLSNWDTCSLERTIRMFNGDPNLKKIYVSNKWTVDKIVTDGSDYMFFGCEKLVGNISYDSSKIDATYANYTNGYLTLKGE